MKLLIFGLPILLIIGTLAYLALRQPPNALDARDRQELEASRDLIRTLLADAVEVSDVDPVLAPKVIDRIRAHQRSLGS